MSVFIQKALSCRTASAFKYSPSIKASNERNGPESTLELYCRMRRACACRYCGSDPGLLLAKADFRLYIRNPASSQNLTVGFLSHHQPHLLRSNLRTCQKSRPQANPSKHFVCRCGGSHRLEIYLTEGSCDPSDRRILVLYSPQAPTNLATFGSRSCAVHWDVGHVSFFPQHIPLLPFRVSFSTSKVYQPIQPP